MTNRFSLFVCMAFIFALSGCANWEATIIQEHEFIPYLSSFEKLSFESASQISIYFSSEVPSYELAHCRITVKSDYTKREIRINRNNWAKATELSREQLLFHELGHCVLNRSHEEGYLSMGIPTTIMNPRHLTDKVYEQNREYYLTELIGKKNTR